jgi:hypothetical protein
MDGRTSAALWALSCAAACATAHPTPAPLTSIPDSVQLQLFEGLLEEAVAHRLPADEVCLVVLGAQPPPSVVDSLRTRWPHVRPGPSCGASAVVDVWQAQDEPPEDVFVSAGYRLGSSGGWHYLYRFKMPGWSAAGRLPFAPQ